MPKDFLQGISGGLFDNQDRIRADHAEARCNQLEQQLAEITAIFARRKRTICSIHTEFLTRNTTH